LESRGFIIIVSNNIIIIIIIICSLSERRLVAPVVYWSVATIRCGGLLAGAQLFPCSGVILGLVPWGGEA
jgi:hypothetical protein